MSLYSDALKASAGNKVIFESFLKADEILNRKGFRNIAVSISGGSDSDIVLDIVSRVEPANVKFVWFDTGIEFDATKEHIVKLEQKYGVKIQREKAIKPIPTCVKEYGVPFLSKMVSSEIERLQKHDFDFKDLSYEEHERDYWIIDSAIRWFYNMNNREGSRNASTRFNIAYNKWLREYLIANPPTFDISNRCCDFAKKDVAKKFYEENNIDLNVTGIRMAEGGVRASVYGSCFDSKTRKSIAKYRPVFWYKDSDKEEYKRIFGVQNSDCYTKYGMTRTGCAGCPYNRNFLEELKVMKTFEPNMYTAAMSIFGESYVYTKRYKDFYKRMNKIEAARGGK